MLNWRRLARIIFQIVIPVAIVVAVGWQFALILSRPELRDVSYPCRVEWLIPAGLLYLMAHSIWACFWVTLLRHHGQQATYRTGLRAYFISQLGKYVPGKIWVILMRMVMLGGETKDKAIVGLTATYEALTAMAAGAILGAILLPMLEIDLNPNAGQPDNENQRIVSQAQGSIMIAVALVPLGVGLLHRLIIGIARKRVGPDVHLPNLNLLVLFRGLVQATFGWLLLGLSVWMVVQAIRPEPVGFTWFDCIRLTAINCLSYILGFIVVVAPAGAGVRELVFRELLPNEMASPDLPVNIAVGFAVVIAIVIRLVWTAAELVLIALLYWFIPAAKRPHLVAEVKELTP